MFDDVAFKRMEIAMRNEKVIEAFIYLIVEVFQNIIERLEGIVGLLSKEFEKYME